MSTGTLTYRLVVTGPTSVYVPGDVSIDTAVDFYVTSRRRVAHPWIELPPEGEGQSLDPLTGQITDGEYRVRVIDVPEACLLGSSAYADDFVDVFTNGWTKHGDTQTLPDPPNIEAYKQPCDTPDNAYGGWWVTTGGGLPTIYGSVLFGWYDNPAGGGIGVGGFQHGPWLRDTWIERVFTGFTPGERVGFHFHADWTLDTGPGNIFASVNTDAVSFSNSAYDFWTIDQALGVNVQDNYVAGYADGAGDVLIRIGAEVYSPSSNVICELIDYEIVTCTTALSTSSTDRYVTSWLADAQARQQLLSRPAYIEVSTDEGSTWNEVLYSGYLTGLRMQDALVYEFALGDTRRVERTRKAFRGVDPTASGAPFTKVTPLIGGPVYGGFPPYVPHVALPHFVVAYVGSDGLVTLTYASGPLPDGYGLWKQTQNKYEVIVARGQPFYRDAAPVAVNSGIRGTYPQLRVWIFDWFTHGLIAGPHVPYGVYLSRGFNTPGGFIREYGLIEVNNGLMALQWEGALPVVGDRYEVMVAPSDLSDAYPLHWSGHPVDLVTTLYTLAGVPYDAASAASVKAALGADLSCSLRFTSSDDTVQDVCERAFGFFRFATRVNGLAEREFVYFGQRIDATPALTLATNDLRAEGGPTFELDEDSIVNRTVLATSLFEPYNAASTDARTNDMIVVRENEVIYDFSTDGGATTDAEVYGEHEHTFTLDGEVAWAIGPTAMNVIQYGDGLARDVFEKHARGVQYATVTTRRGTAADSALLSDAVELDALHVPNAQLGQTPVSQRGGARWWKVVRRSDESEGPVLRLADESTGVAYGGAVTLALTPDLTEPIQFQVLTITGASSLFSDRAQLELEVAFGVVAPVVPGVRYTVLDGAAMDTEPFDVRLGPFPAGEIVWVRARAFAYGSAPGAWTGWASIGGGTGLDLDNLVISAIGPTSATLAWDNADVVNQVRISTRIDNTGAWLTYSTIAISSITETLAGLSPNTVYGVEVVLWDGAAEVGTALLGVFTTSSGGLSSLAISGSPGAHDCGMTWTNTDLVYQVKVEYQDDAAGGPFIPTIYPIGSTRATITGLDPSTLYNVRVVLVGFLFVEVGSALTGSFTTAGVGSALLPPDNLGAFAGMDPRTGVPQFGVWGALIYPNLANPPHYIVWETAIETGVGTGIPGTYAVALTVSAIMTGAPNYFFGTARPFPPFASNGLKIFFRALARLSGLTDSAYAPAVSVDPFSVTPPPGGTLRRSVVITAAALAEDAIANGSVTLPPYAAIYQVAVNTHPARLVLYDSAAARTADAARLASTVLSPAPGVGCYLDVILTSAESYTINLSPTVTIIDPNGVGGFVTVYWAIKNYDTLNTIVFTVYYVENAPPYGVLP